MNERFEERKERKNIIAKNWCKIFMLCTVLVYSTNWCPCLKWTKFTKKCVLQCLMFHIKWPNVKSIGGYICYQLQQIWKWKVFQAWYIDEWCNCLVKSKINIGLYKERNLQNAYHHLQMTCASGDHETHPLILMFVMLVAINLWNWTLFHTYLLPMNMYAKQLNAKWSNVFIKVTC